MPDNKPTNRERLREITEGIEQGIKELFESEKYMRYLSVMSRFHRYSVNNTMLIYMQKPDATLVAGFNKWKNQFERHVKKGEHGITIIAPTPYKKKIEEQKLDPDTKVPILDKDGRIVTEEKEIEIPMFRPVKVFDLSQTDGKPLPELASNLSGNVQNFEVFMEALQRSAPVPIEFEPMDASMDGYFSSEQQRIAIRTGMSEVQTVSAAVHETAHSKLHDPKKFEVEQSWKVVMVSEGGTKHDFKMDFATEAEAEQFAADENWRYLDENQFEWRLEVEEDLTAVQQVVKNRHTEEVEAESISYAVCQYYGIETSENSFGYIASWSQGKELKELRASLETISKTSCELISDIDRHYKEICKERGIDLTATPEPKTDLVTSPAMTSINMEVDPKVMDNVIALLQVQSSREKVAFDLDGDEYIAIQICNGGYDYSIYSGEDFEKIGAGKLENYSLEQAAYKLLMDEMKGTDYVEPYEYDTLMKQVADVQKQHSSQKGKNEVQETSASMLQEQIFDEDFIPDPNLVKMADEAMAMGIDTVWNAEKEFPLSFETTETSNQQQMQEVSNLPTQLPDAQEQALDEYPMPDPVLTQDDLEKCGYLDSDLLPLSKERAYELMERDLTVYIVQEGENPEMAFDSTDLDAHDGIFAVSREEWEQSPQFHEKVLERQDRQLEREQTFLSHEGDCFAIYQVKHTDELRDIRYEGLDWLKSIGRKVERENYDLIYTAPLQSADKPEAVVEQLFYQFNNEHPADYHSPSMSVSDIVAIKQGGKVSCHYCDSYCFTEISGFLPDNPLKNAEMAVEDDYGMIDGVINNGSKEPTVAQLEQQARSGQPISLLDLAAATHREERDKKKSVMEQLKSQPKTEHKKKAPQKSAEREI